MKKDKHASISEGRKSFLSYFDLKMGLAGALFLGLVVFFINYEHGSGPALVAALKQGAYTFFAGGFIVRFCKAMAERIDNPIAAALLWTLLPSLIAVGATYGVHLLKGTPEPINSTIPTVILAPVSFAVIGWIRRKNIAKEDS